MTAAKSTIVYLKQIMPGQPEAWYQRIATDITAGKMPLPKVDGIEPPNLITPTHQRALEALTDSKQGHFPSTGQWQPPEPPPPEPIAEPEPEPPKLQIVINPARQRFLNSLSVSESATQDHFPSTGQQQKTSPIPDTVAEALSQWQKPPKPTPKPRPSQPVSAATESALYRLTKDRRVSLRLVDRIRANNPDKSEQWCWEKAICDLERDRHA
jgi:hypothetical protein